MIYRGGGRLKPCRKAGFTLAEILITLGIIGVVAAMVIPSLISSFQKKIYYSKFMKARMIVENALKLYTEETGCDTLHCGGTSRVEDFTKYFNVSTYVTENNYKNICKNYNKVAYKYDGTNVMNQPWLCYENVVCDKSSANYAFITKDGMLFNFCTHWGFGYGSVIDTNGPNQGPNTFGRDIFLTYITLSEQNQPWLCGSIWGQSKACNEQINDPSYQANSCYDDGKKFGMNCAVRLIEEGKMNY